MTQPNKDTKIRNAGARLEGHLPNAIANFAAGMSELQQAVRDLSMVIDRAERATRREG